MCSAFLDCPADSKQSKSVQHFSRKRSDYMAGRNSGARKPNRTLAQAETPNARAADCIKALGAPQRRRKLRVLQEAGEARSPNEIAEAFGVPVGYVSYHVKVLRDCGALALTDTQHKRGAVEHFYASTVTNNGLVVQALEVTRADDE
jgi:DNA-binding transcriptional ArsR family regulator